MEALTDASHVYAVERRDSGRDCVPLAPPTQS